MKHIIRIFIIACWPLSMQTGLIDSKRLIIWNVGQGLWITVIEPKACLHFDSGGQKKPPERLLSRCKNISNRHYLSHLDWDHRGYLSYLKRNFKLCRVGSPDEPSRLQAQVQYEQITTCSEKISSVTELKPGLSGKNPNDQSRIFVYKNWVLLPGDSTRKAEKYWAPQLTGDVRVLVLGHHGSLTSTGKVLLQSLPNLILAVASARKSKYGHPHEKLAQRLKKYGIPVLKTEDWGNIILETP